MKREFPPCPVGCSKGHPPPPALQYEPARGAAGRPCAVATLRRTSPRSLTLRPKRAKVRESPNRTKDEDIINHIVRSEHQACACCLFSWRSILDWREPAPGRLTGANDRSLTACRSTYFTGIAPQRVVMAILLSAPCGQAPRAGQKASTTRPYCRPLAVPPRDSESLRHPICY